MRRALFAIPLLFFALGFVSIVTALSAIGCMALPFLLLARDGKKTWCRGVCPRSSLLDRMGSLKWQRRRAPSPFRDGSLRSLMLWYVALNLLFALGSTAKVAAGQMEAMAYVRLFIAIPLAPLPQLFDLGLPPALLHLSYRFYSMMLGTTLLAVGLGLFFRPRIWCTVCPVSTISNGWLGKKRGRFSPTHVQ